MLYLSCPGVSVGGTLAQQDEVVAGLVFAGGLPALWPALASPLITARREKRLKLSRARTLQFSLSSCKAQRFSGCGVPFAREFPFS